MVTQAASLAKWEVIWITGKRIIRRDYGNDLAEAQRVYALAVTGRKKAVTLRCKNMAFPPPEKYRRRHVKGKLNGRVVEGWYDPMKRLNSQGVWWCPYCMKLRRFVKRAGYYVQGVYVEEARYVCPICSVSHKNTQVRMHNPVAQRMAAAPGRRSKRRRR